MLTTYEECKQLSETRKRKLGNNTYLEIQSDTYGIRLHNTQIVTFYADGRVVLDSDGWQTVTTKDRMNRCLPDGWRIWSDKGIWYLGKYHHDKGYPLAKIYAYADGITINPDGSVSNVGKDPNKQIRLRKQIDKYARDYVAALVVGKVESPNNGDCFCCQFEIHEANHILSHIDEKYYVPSLLKKALERFGTSQAMWHELSCIWGNKPELSCFGDFTFKQMEKALRRYCYAEVGLPI